MSLPGSSAPAVVRPVVGLTVGAVARCTYERVCSAPTGTGIRFVVVTTLE